jgi:hypothetical protein
LPRQRIWIPAFAGMTVGEEGEEDEEGEDQQEGGGGLIRGGDRC